MTDIQSDILRILVVEDSIRKYEQIRDVCEESVGLSHVMLAHVTSVSDAMARLIEVSYDLLILDLYLPMRNNESADKESSLNLLSELRRVGKMEFNIPSHIVGLTQYEDLKAEHHEVFLREGWQLLLYSDAVAEWRQTLATKLKELSRHSSSRSFARTSSTSRFDEAFRDRLSWLLTTIHAMSIDTDISTSVRYLCHLESIGSLRRLVYEAGSEPKALPGDSGAFYFSLDNGMICFGAKFKSAWLSMVEDLQLTDGEFGDSLDNFILHELFHVGQQLTTERHGDIRHAQSVLRVLDYHADANAGLAAMALYARDPRNAEQGWRVTSVRVLLSVLRQIYVFDYATKPPKMLVSRLVRHFTWHYHYHRVSGYSGVHPFTRHPLSVEPAFNFRGSPAASSEGGFSQKWPSEESAEVARDKPHLWMAIPNQFGIPTVYRFLSTKRENYQALFDGIFTCNVDLTALFLRELFNQYGELIRD